MPRKKARRTCTRDIGDFSSLPDDIVKRIMESLPPRDAALMGFSCTSWYRAWASHPLYAFHFCLQEFIRKNFPNMLFTTEQDDAFLTYINDILGRLPTLNGTVRTFFLTVSEHDRYMFLNKNLSLFIPSWFDILSQHHIKEVELNVPGFCTISTALLKLESLVSLRLSGVHLNEKLIFQDFNFPSLRDISITYSKAKVKLLEKLFSHCPLLENLLLELCLPLDEEGTLTIFNNPKLKILTLQKVAFQACNIENLEILCCKNHNLKDLELPTCGKLKELKLLPDSYNPEDLKQFLLKFPLLEKLVVDFKGILPCLSAQTPLLGNLKHLTLLIEEELNDYGRFWDSLLLICRPQHVSFISGFASRIYSKLVEGLLQDYERVGGSSSALVYRTCHPATSTNIDLQCELLGANWPCDLLSVEFRWYCYYNRCWYATLESLKAALRSPIIQDDKSTHTRVSVSFKWKDASD